jgi:hypothetical protein
MGIRLGHVTTATERSTRACFAWNQIERNYHGRPKAWKLQLGSVEGATEVRSIGLAHRRARARRGENADVTNLGRKGRKVIGVGTCGVEQRASPIFANHIARATQAKVPSNGPGDRIERHGGPSWPENKESVAGDQKGNESTFVVMVALVRRGNGKVLMGVLQQDPMGGNASSVL